MRSQPEVVESLETRKLIFKARSDNTDLYRNFADKILAFPLQDEVHGHGMDNRLLLECYLDKRSQFRKYMDISVQVTGCMENR